jgi:hypothetical protein
MKASLEAYDFRKLHKKSQLFLKKMEYVKEATQKIQRPKFGRLKF